MGNADQRALRLQGLTKFYGKQPGIVDLDLAVEQGEVFGFLGPNGAGKTTTIRLILGLIHATRGTAEVLGLDCRRDGPRARAQIGYLPGDLSLYDRMRGRQLLRFLSQMRGDLDTSGYEALAERLSLDLNRRVRDLSKGNRQKLGVVQAFMHSPPVLVLDEPTSGLDPLVQVEFQKLVRESVESGATVFLSSHVLTEVQQMADRVGIVSGNRLLVVDSVDGLRERTARRVELDFPVVPPPELAGCDGVLAVEVRGGTAICTVAGGIGPLLKVAVDHGVVDAHTHDPDLETAFLGYVSGQDPSAAAPTGAAASGGASS